MGVGEEEAYKEVRSRDTKMKDRENKSEKQIGKTVASCRSRIKGQDKVQYSRREMRERGKTEAPALPRKLLRKI